MEANALKEKISKNLVVFLVATLVTVVAWAAIGIFNVLQETEDISGIEEYLTPLPSSYEAETLNELEVRKEERMLYNPDAILENN